LLVSWLGSLGDGSQEDGSETSDVGDGQNCPSYADALEIAFDALGNDA
jgi:hypothetical protein